MLVRAGALHLSFSVLEKEKNAGAETRRFS
jgi:hypothetical protein